MNKNKHPNEDKAKSVMSFLYQALLQLYKIEEQNNITVFLFLRINISKPLRVGSIMYGTMYVPILSFYSKITNA